MVKQGNVFFCWAIAALRQRIRAIQAARNLPPPGKPCQPEAQLPPAGWGGGKFMNPKHTYDCMQRIACMGFWEDISMPWTRCPLMSMTLSR